MYSDDVTSAPMHSYLHTILYDAGHTRVHHYVHKIITLHVCVLHIATQFSLDIDACYIMNTSLWFILEHMHVAII